MSNQINLAPITQFVQTLRAAELGQQKEVKIPIQQARLLNLVLTEMQQKLLQDYESLYSNLKNNSSNDVVQINLDGGGFSNN
jgi:hypothetical protein